MLVQYTPTQISANWPIIEHGIKVAIPPFSKADTPALARIFESLLKGDMQCWFSESAEGQKYAVVITTMSNDFVSGVKNFLVYALYGLSNIPDSEWEAGRHTLVEYAKSQKCNKIVAYSDVARIIQLARELGGDTRYTFITFDLE